MILDIKNNAKHRKMYQAAKNAFRQTSEWHICAGQATRQAMTTMNEQSKIFLDAFAKSHNARIIVSRQFEWLDIMALDFDDEKDYVMFLLRWS